MHRTPCLCHQANDGKVSIVAAAGQHRVTINRHAGAVNTRIYHYQRSPGGPELEDNTLALRLWSGKTQRSKTYPLPDELRHFGREVCSVRDPQAPLNRIAQAMTDTLHAAASDPRIPASLLEQLRPSWENGIRFRQ